MTYDTAIGSITDPIDRFFAFCRERHTIYLRKIGALPRLAGGVLTDDPVLQEYRFTNIFRELDKTTIWFREHVREPMRRDPGVLLATVLFRWFNRITTGETLFLQWDMIDGGAPFDRFRESALEPMAKRLKILRDPLVKQGPPWITGSYIINTAAQVGMTKLDGILHLLGQFCKRPWFQYAQGLLSDRNTLEDVQAWLEEVEGLGPFMAYEIVSDLRWTDMLCDAPDIMTWANPGLGAKRGLWRIGGATNENEVRRPFEKREAIITMHELLLLSQDPSNWPPIWPRWEMREVEHSLCEFDKYERTMLGQGRPRGKYK